VKPFSPRELVLRVRAVLKRNAPAEPVAKQASLKIDGLVMDMDAYKVLIDGEEVLLTATEFKLLAELLKNKGRVRTRDQLLNTVWGYEFEGYARTVDTHVRRLRQKIGDYANYIETMRGVGYRFKD
jgi:two-component system phosphate regulon response regulator PhoB